MKILTFGIGGGGDALSAIIPWSYFTKLGHEVKIGAIVWERYVEDPIPGPICKEDLRNFEEINDSVYLVSKDSYAVRGGKKVVPQLMRVLSVIKDVGYAVCNKLGDIGMTEALTDVVRKEKFDMVIGVDAGGDVLANGNEQGLGSPLIDAISLSALVNLDNSLLGVIGAGSDGELDYDYVLHRISEVAKLGGLVDSKGIDLETAEIMEKALKLVTTEASKIPLEAFKGTYGEITIRNGTRKVYVTPVSSIMFFINPKKLAEISGIYKIVRNSKTLEEANEKFHKHGIYTEYDFEKDLYEKFGLDASKASSSDIQKVRKDGIERLKYRNPFN